MGQSQKSLGQSKIPVLFAAKQSKIMNLRLFVTACMWRLLI